MKRSPNGQFAPSSPRTSRPYNPLEDYPPAPIDQFPGHAPPAPAQSERKSCLVASNAKLPPKQAVHFSPVIVATCRRLNIQARIIVWLAWLARWLFYLGGLANLILAFAAGLREEAVGPASKFLLFCFWATDRQECRRRALNALFPTEQLAEATRFSVQIAENGLAQSPILHSVDVPLIFGNFAIAMALALLCLLCACVCRLVHNQAAHVCAITWAVAAEHSQTAPAGLSDGPVLL